MEHAQLIEWLFVTGTRADFAKLCPLIDAIIDSQQTFKIVCCGMHLLEEYGFTADEVIGKYSGHIVLLSNVFYDTPMDRSFSNSARAISDYLEFNPAKNMLVHGDRVEALAIGAIGALRGIKVIHMEGGEVSGTIDESMRHALTKLSHAHLVSNHEASDRIISMGESPERVFEIGSPEVDKILDIDTSSMDWVRERYEIEFDNYYVFIIHPVVTSNSFADKVKEVFKALKDSGKNFVCLRPNNDSHSQAIHKELETIEKSSDTKFRVLPSMRFDAFITLLANSQAIIGNSSSGVREAPVLGVWSINIGSRQNGRSAAKSILNCEMESQEVLKKIQVVEESEQPSPEFIFGDGKSGKKFMELVNNRVFDDLPLQKVFYE